jgi:hypothetical protein
MSGGKSSSVKKFGIFIAHGDTVFAHKWTEGADERFLQSSKVLHPWLRD